MGSGGSGEEAREALRLGALLSVSIGSLELWIVVNAVRVSAEAAVFEGMLVGWMTAGSWYKDMEGVGSVRVGAE